MKTASGLARALSYAVLAAVPLGCNALLGNEEGTPRGASEAGAPTSDSGVAGFGGLVCDTTQGNKVCFGLCVRIDQPNTGCGGVACAACDPKNVRATACKGGAETLSCAYDVCKTGFDDCDGHSANGCETSLGDKDSCGSCTTKCSSGTPLCAVTNGVAACVASCPTGTKECGGACVDTSTSIANCGTCGNKCERAAATAACEKGKCVYVCQGGTHACGGSCASDLDPNFCGASCLACPPPAPHTTATCDRGTCGSVCAAGYLDCDGNAANGCEVNALLCPVLGGSCGGLTCNKSEQCCNGRCVSDQPTCGGPTPQAR